MIILWLRRSLLTSKYILKFETLVSILSLTLGVACLVVTMTVMSSYETTLQKTLIDRVGHLMVVSPDKPLFVPDIKRKVQKLLPLSHTLTPFISVEALALNQGDLKGILFEGIDLKSVKKVLNLESQIIQGQFIQNSSEVLIGKELASQLNLKPQSSISIVYTKSTDQDSWSPRLKKFNVSGIVDLGRHDFNSRYVATSLSSIQSLTGLKDQVMGARIRLMDNFSSEELRTLSQNLSSDFWVQDWKAIHQNLFTAIQMEKILIFFILLVLIVVAGFNVSNQLFLDVLTRFRDIGILKAMGGGSFLVIQLFLSQGMTVGIIGTLMGFFLGIVICYGLFEIYDIWSVLIPSEVYKLNQIILDFRWEDFVYIFIFSLLICLLSTWIPIRKALRLTPKEGLMVE